jgi:hypothetical protein
VCLDCSCMPSANERSRPIAPRSLHVYRQNTVTFIFSSLFAFRLQIYMFFLIWRYQKRLEHYQNMKGPFGGGTYYVHILGLSRDANCRKCSSICLMLYHRKCLVLIYFGLHYYFLHRILRMSNLRCSQRRGDYSLSIVLHSSLDLIAFLSRTFPTSLCDFLPLARVRASLRPDLRLTTYHDLSHDPLSFFSLSRPPFTMISSNLSLLSYLSCTSAISCMYVNIVSISRLSMAPS